VGSSRLGDDPTLAAQRRLARCLRLAWRGRTRRGFFLRAEDFFGFQKGLAAARAEHEAEIARIDVDLADGSEYARKLAKGPHRASLGGMEQRYGADPDAASHGQAYLRLFGSRLVPGGLYLMDEPEAALSPQSQLALLAMMKEGVDSGSQFIVATHAPILMSAPGATILSFDETPVCPVAYDDLESVRLVRDFLAAPELFLRLVWSDAEPNS
jgi:predicted ATPase